MIIVTLLYRLRHLNFKICTQWYTGVQLSINILHQNPVDVDLREVTGLTVAHLVWHIDEGNTRML